jgi:hypothetical protein
MPEEIHVRVDPQLDGGCFEAAALGAVACNPQARVAELSSNPRERSKRYLRAFLRDKPTSESDDGRRMTMSRSDRRRNSWRDDAVHLKSVTLESLSKRAAGDKCPIDYPQPPTQERELY